MNELSDLMAADGRGIAAANSPDRVWAVPRRLEQAALIALQLLGLCALNYAGIWFVRRTGLPVPGNLIGMVGSQSGSGPASGIVIGHSPKACLTKIPSHSRFWTSISIGSSGAAPP